MQLYYAVPKRFRDDLKDDFRRGLEMGTTRSFCLEMLPTGNAPRPTIFSIVLKDRETPLPQDTVADIYHTLRRGASTAHPTLRPIQLGQPVVLSALGTAALRFSLSARLIRQCWSKNPDEALRKRAALFEDIFLAVGQLDGLARQVGNINRSLKRA